MSNVFAFVASATNYTNVALAEADFPLTNLTGVAAGPLNAGAYVPFTAPNTSAVGAGGQGVFVAPSLNTSLTPAAAPAPVNLTAANATVPAAGPVNASASAGAPGPSGSGAASGAQRVRARGAALVLGLAMAAVAAAL